ncbi:MAG: FtsX-like permease family protein [Oscillospiraceae bacterium]
MALPRCRPAWKLPAALSCCAMWPPLWPIILVVMLVLISISIIANTIKLATFTRREEIAIMKMCGATNWFVRWPFLVEGMILGLTGASSPSSASGAFMASSSKPLTRATCWALSAPCPSPACPTGFCWSSWLRASSSAPAVR